jgi:signal transduction histidine kinase
MASREITPQNITSALVGGFAIVIAFLLTASAVGVGNIQSIQQNASALVSEHSLTKQLTDELLRQQRSLSEVFSILARDPDSLDYSRMMDQLDEADRDIAHISQVGEGTPDRELWLRLNQASKAFSAEARRLVTAEDPESFSSDELFRDHAAFSSIVARLLGAEYRKAATQQQQINLRSSRLLTISIICGTASLLLAVVFALLTVRLIRQLTVGLETQTAELGRVSWHMLADQEATARRFSHELHDELGQALTAVKTNLTAPDAAKRLQDTLELVDEAIGNVRQMSQLLHPTVLDDFGLEPALRWLCEGFAARTGLNVYFQSHYTDRLPEDAETHLYRIAQEALTNVARHSEATRVEVRLEAEGPEVTLRIRDDGRGLPAVNGRRGLGLIGMRARARSTGGTVNVESGPGRGVLIEVRVPVPHEAHSHSPG